MKYFESVTLVFKLVISIATFDFRSLALTGNVGVDVFDYITRDTSPRTVIPLSCPGSRDFERRCLASPSVSVRPR